MLLTSMKVSSEIARDALTSKVALSGLPRVHDMAAEMATATATQAENGFQHEPKWPRNATRGHKNGQEKPSLQIRHSSPGSHVHVPLGWVWQDVHNSQFGGKTIGVWGCGGTLGSFGLFLACVRSVFKLFFVSFSVFSFFSQFCLSFCFE